MSQTECGDEICLTCSDDARAGYLVAAPAKDFFPTGVGTVRTDTGDETVDLALVPGARVGDRLLIHAGVAIAALDQEGGLA